MQNNLFNDALEKKIFWLEKRIASAQRDLWLFKTMIEMTQGNQSTSSPRKKAQQIDMFAG
jgi:hypothetical protein